MRAELAKLREQIQHLEADQAIEDVDPERFDWYAESCSCGLPAGECRIHPRARENQRPPTGEWSTYLATCGRGWGKTRSAVEWCRWMIETGQSRRFAIVGSTAADCRDVLIEGESGLLSVCPPWFYPKYEASKKRLTFPNGGIVTTYSAAEPDRLRGPQHDAALCDEIAAWEEPSTYDMLLFGLRLGRNPKTMIATTPRPTKLIKRLLSDPKTTLVRGSTYENRNNLMPTFFDNVISTYSGTRLGRQEIDAEVLEVGESAWFQNFCDERNVSTLAEFMPGKMVYCSVDAGVSRYTGAVFGQYRNVGVNRPMVTIFGDFLSVDQTSEENAIAIRELGLRLPCEGHIDALKLDPAANARSGNGPAATGEYERVWGSRIVSTWPQHRVIDGLDQLEILIGGPNREPELIIHPRCARLIEALKTYKHNEKRGEVMDEPCPVQHPAEDLTDALRGLIRFLMPEGHRPKPILRNVHFTALRY